MHMPAQQHHIERIAAGVSGKPVTITMKAANGTVRLFGSVDEAQREAARLGGRPAGYRVITTFVGAGGAPTSFRLTTDWDHDTEDSITLS